MHTDLLHQIALTQVPNIGDVRAKALVDVFGSAESIFKASKNQLEKIEGIGTVAASAIKEFADFKICEEEIKFIQKNKITTLFITDEHYPKRLLNCYDSPTLLYYKGTANLNTSKILSIVGTRANSDYGKICCDKIIEDLATLNILIISGLAFGIDTLAHKASLKNNLQTIGVLAHGLDKIYPAANKPLAKDMLAQGGLLSHFMSRTNPDRQNFPSRNRIVAGMCDALLVVESSAKGGSLITAELANSYNKDVFALPGKATDARSEGCNYLIRNNKATLITSAKDLLESMNWDVAPKKPKAQRSLFIELTPHEKIITDILTLQQSVQIDELYFKSKLSSSEVAQALLMLEMQGVVAAMPGKVFKLL